MASRGRHLQASSDQLLGPVPRRRRMSLIGEIITYCAMSHQGPHSDEALACGAHIRGLTRLDFLGHAPTELLRIGGRHADILSAEPNSDKCQVGRTHVNTFCDWVSHEHAWQTAVYVAVTPTATSIPRSDSIDHSPC